MLGAVTNTLGLATVPENNPAVHIMTERAHQWVHDLPRVLLLHIVRVDSSMKNASGVRVK